MKFYQLGVTVKPKDPHAPVYEDIVSRRRNKNFDKLCQAFVNGMPTAEDLNPYFFFLEGFVEFPELGALSQHVENCLQAYLALHNDTWIDVTVYERDPATQALAYVCMIHNSDIAARELSVLEAYEAVQQAQEERQREIAEARLRVQKRALAEQIDKLPLPVAVTALEEALRRAEELLAQVKDPSK